MCYATAWSFAQLIQKSISTRACTDTRYIIFNTRLLKLSKICDLHILKLSSNLLEIIYVTNCAMLWSNDYLASNDMPICKIWPLGFSFIIFSRKVSIQVGLIAIIPPPPQSPPIQKHTPDKHPNPNKINRQHQDYRTLIQQPTFVLYSTMVPVNICIVESYTLSLHLVFLKKKKERNTLYHAVCNIVTYAPGGCAI